MLVPPVTPSPPPDRIPKPTATTGRATPVPAPGTPPGPPTRIRSGSQRQTYQPPQQSDSDDLNAPRVSHVRILPTSLPYVHDQLMEQREREREREREQRNQAADRLSDEQAQRGPESEGDSRRGGRSPEEQEATARALKPHSRSIIDLEKLRLEPPEGRSAPHQPKKSRKWQFGIRSRNQPYEAMLYLYKAIEAQGGIWEIQPAGAGESILDLLLDSVD